MGHSRYEGRPLTCVRILRTKSHDLKAAGLPCTVYAHVLSLDSHHKTHTSTHTHVHAGNYFIDLQNDMHSIRCARREQHDISSTHTYNALRLSKEGSDPTSTSVKKHLERNDPLPKIELESVRLSHV